MGLKLSLLGPFQAWLGTEPLADFRNRKTQALLIYLTVEATLPGRRREHQREQLMELLWPGLPQPSAQVNLRQTLYQLRQLVPEVDPHNGGKPVSFVLSDRQLIWLHPEATFELDVATFVKEAERNEDIEALAQAAALYRGDFLANFYLPDSESFEAWVAARRAEFRRLALDALARLTNLHLQQFDYEKSERYARRQLELDDLRESAHRQLMEALASQGQRSAALAQYDACRELGVEPAAETEALYQAIRRGEVGKSEVAGRIRGYELKEKVGEGSYGAVYRAYQPAVDRDVAIKVIRPEYANDPDFIRRFEAEAQTVARLEHPRIVPLYDYWREPGGAYLVMRWLRGGSLKEALEAGAWPVERALPLVEQIAAALHLAHHHGVVHRDLKPANILLDEEGNAYLGDFGIARRLADTTTQTGGFAGSPAYVSPEQLLGERVTPQSDIYTFGLVAYELLAGERPFAGESLAGILHKHLHEPLPSLQARRPELPPAVDEVLQRATAKKPAERYADALAFAVALRQALVSDRESGSPEQPVIPPAATPSTPTPSSRHNLPAQLTSFVGRQQEIEAVERLLQTSRLLTLTGTGGTGKTRLALEVANRMLSHYRDGVTFVGLAPLDDPTLLLGSVTQTLGVQEQPGESLLTSLQRFLGRRQLLLLLDNFEHLVSGAPLVADLLAAAPQLTVLVTSREPLRLSGEQEYPVAPLELPSGGDEPLAAAVQSPAVQLFLERAQAARPHLQLDEQNALAVVQICALLDGLPLAIELAAARTRLFTPPVLLARLQGTANQSHTAPTLRLLSSGARDLPARQQTLRATIDWSYHLLTAEEQRLFRRLAVFAGGCTLEAAEVVWGAEHEEAVDIIDPLSSLVDKNLLRVDDGPEGEPRFWMLHVIREYARGRLERLREAQQVGERHAHYFLDLAEKAEPQLLGPEQAAGLSRLETEHDNLRAALRWAQQHNRIEMGLRAATALSRFWRTRGHVSEGRRWLEAMLAESDKAPLQLRANVLHAAAALALFQDEQFSSLEWGEKGLAIYRELGDQRGIAQSLDLLGIAYMNMGRREEATALLEESLLISQELNDKSLTADILMNLGSIALFKRDYTNARSLLEEGLSQARAAGSPGRIGTALALTGILAADQGDFERARDRLERALDAIRVLQISRLEAFIISHIARVALRSGDWEEATSALLRALETFVEFEVWTEDASGCLEGLARVAAEKAQDERAVRLWGAADVLRAGIDPWPIDREDRERAVASVRARMMPDAFARAWTEGQRMAREAREELIAFAAMPEVSDTLAPLQGSHAELYRS